jgi:hypothetical protein
MDDAFASILSITTQVPVTLLGANSVDFILDYGAGRHICGAPGFLPNSSSS